MQNHILSIILFTPLLGAIVLLFVLLSLWPGSKRQVGDSLALLGDVVGAVPVGMPESFGNTVAVSVVLTPVATGFWEASTVIVESALVTVSTVAGVDELLANVLLPV